MPNIFKRFSFAKEAEPYRFPDAAELLTEEEEEPFRPLGEEEPDSGEEDGAETPESEEESEPEEMNPVDYAQVQADMILQDARREAEAIMEQAKQDALNEAEDVKAAAREAGRMEGYQAGLLQAREESAAAREEQAAALEQEVERFLERAGAELDRQMDQSVNELRDLAMAIAEKVVCISLKSSGDVISRMIQTAIDKRKRREWVHIYIAECDAKKLGQAPSTLMSSLAALSDRVRIIPMADDESGTCIIEMPDEIVDASAATQLNNIRSLLMDASPAAAENFNFNVF